MENTLNQLIGFGLVGVLNTLVDFALFHWLAARRRWGPWQAHCCSGTAALLTSFLLNRYVVFRPGHEAPFERLPGFLLVTAFSLYVLQPVVLLVGERACSRLSSARWGRLAGRPGLSRDLAKGGAILAGLVWNFSWYKTFVFADLDKPFT